MILIFILVFPFKNSNFPIPYMGNLLLWFDLLLFGIKPVTLLLIIILTIKQTVVLISYFYYLYQLKGNGHSMCISWPARIPKKWGSAICLLNSLISSSYNIILRHFQYPLWILLTFSVGIYRLPVELGFAQSLMPLHSITASALLISMLSLKPGSWAWLSEGNSLLFLASCILRSGFL